MTGRERRDLVAALNDRIRELHPSIDKVDDRSRPSTPWLDLRIVREPEPDDDEFGH
jgi:hypothetical protein